MSRTATIGAPRADSRSSNEAWWPDDYGARPAPRHKKPVRRPNESQRGAKPDLVPRQDPPAAKAHGSGALSRALMYMTIALLMALLFVQIGRLAQIAAQTKRISGLQAGIREMQNEKSNLLVRLSMQQNINRVRDEAIYKLGMTHPEDGQIRVVSLNGDSVNIRTQTADNIIGTGSTE